jgi:uncharacterized protein YneF (UPF0154 family)
VNSSWLWLVILAVILGAIGGIPLGYWCGKRDMELKFEEWRQAQIRKKQVQLNRNGRRLPAVEGAGPPIVQRRMAFRRGPIPKK